VSASVHDGWWRPGRGPTGVAHRGAPHEAPENTLASFQRALEAGAAAVEGDVQRTRDGRLVIIHDQTLERTTSGRGRVVDVTFEELRRLDAGGWFAPAFAGERVPLLDEVLDLVRGRARIFLEIKNGPVFYDGIEIEVAASLRRHGIERDALVMSFDHLAVRAMRETAPDVATGVVYDARLIDPNAAARAARADVVCPRWRLVSEDVVAATHAAGLGVFPWTIDDEDAMRRCLAWGADGITSNDARMLVRVLAAAGGAQA
jgi:glycerophosphoryl diester phosphodiesterase